MHVGVERAVAITSREIKFVDEGGDALFNALIAATVDGVIVVDADGCIRVFNAACETLFGYAPDEVIGQNVKVLMPAPYRDEHDQYLSNYARTGERRITGIGREVSGRRKDGSTFPVYLSVGEGELGGNRIFVGIIRDLTLLKSEIALREDADRLLAQIVQSSDDAIIGKTLDGIIMSWNAAAERIFGYGAQEAVGQHISLLIPQDRLAEEDDIIARLRAGRGIKHFRTVRRHKNGAEIDVWISVSPICDATGRVFGASKTVRDIADQIRAEARLAQMQSDMAHVGRLNSMGQMSTALAHELNQPLSAITNYIEAAQLTLGNSNDPAAVRARELLEKAVSQTLRAGAIVRNLREFVEKRESECRPEDINAVIEEAIALAFMGAADCGVHVSLALDAALPPVMIDRIQIQQVMVNLTRNAMEAMSSSERRELAIATGLEGDQVTITVRDTGPGFSEAASARLFQPFNTSKEKGMGIGLTICKAIVESHGGRISAESTEGRGATFCIRIPLSGDEEAAR